MEIVPNVYLIHGPIVNCYLIADQAGLILIDTGLPNNARKIMAAIRELGKDPSVLHTIVITHADSDHFGCLAELQAAIPGAKTLCSHPEAVAIRTGGSSRPFARRGISGAAYGLLISVIKTAPARIDEEITAGYRFSALGFLNVLSTPGQTPGHISLFSPSTGLLFSGDSIVFKGKKIEPPSGVKTWNATAARQSFDMQVSLHPSWILGGHGRIELTSNPDLDP